MKKLLMVVGCVAAFALGGVAAVAAQPGSNNPGSPGDNCSHGNANKPCKPDPQPDRGKDCLDHGNARGNEDYCLGTTETTDTTHTDTTDTTHTDTTHTDTTDTTHTDTTHTDTTHTDTTGHTDTTPTHP